MTLLYLATDQVWVSSYCNIVCRSYSPFGNKNTGNTHFTSLFSYMLWHIELIFCIWLLYCTTDQFRVSSCTQLLFLGANQKNQDGDRWIWFAYTCSPSAIERTAPYQVCVVRSIMSTKMPPWMADTVSSSLWLLNGILQALTKSKYATH